MIQKVTLPKLGETVETSTIEKWLKKEGDKINVGDILCEITTDKATLEVESYHRGTLLKIVAPTGVELPVGALMAILGDPGETIPPEILAEAGAVPAPGGAKTKAEPRAAAAATTTAETPMPTVPAHTGRTAGRLPASPRARRAARELGVSLQNLRGTGPGGRIVEADVQAAANAAQAVSASPVARKLAASMGVDLAAATGSGHAGKIMKDDVLRAATPAASAPAPAPTPGGKVIPLSAMRRIIAQRMLEAKQTIPCYYLEMDADATDLVALRNQLNQDAADGKITFNDFLLKACGAALRAFPVVNSRWVEGGIERRPSVNVAFAVALDDGLITPVVRDVDRKPLRQIAAESADLVQRARTRKLLPEEYQGASMTLSNLGMFGIKSFIPIVNPGESVILGLGVSEDRVICRQGNIQIRKMMTLTLAADHRLVDGAVGAQFLEVIRDALEVPQKLVE